MATHVVWGGHISCQIPGHPYTVFALGFYNLNVFPALSDIYEDLIDRYG